MILYTISTYQVIALLGSLNLILEVLNSLNVDVSTFFSFIAFLNFSSFGSYVEANEPLTPCLVSMYHQAYFGMTKC